MTVPTSIPQLEIAEIKIGPRLGCIGIASCPGRGMRKSAKMNADRNLDADLQQIRDWGCNGIIEDIKVALTGVRSWPFALTGTEKFFGEALTDGVLDELRDMARQQSKPMRTSTIAPWYRRRVVGALTRRLVARLAEG